MTLANHIFLVIDDTCMIYFRITYLINLEVRIETHNVSPICLSILASNINVATQITGISNIYYMSGKSPWFDELFWTKGLYRHITTQMQRFFCIYDEVYGEVSFSNDCRIWLLFVVKHTKTHWSTNNLKLWIYSWWNCYTIFIYIDMILLLTTYGDNRVFT